MTEDGEDLRRRLYRPGADPGDVQAYLAVREPEQEVLPEVRAGTTRRPAGRRWLSVIAAVAVAAAVVTVLAVLRQPADIGPVAHPAAPPTALPTTTIDRSTSASFVGRIRSDRDAELAAWWDPGAPFVEEHGVGSSTVALPPPAGSGRITVLLVLAADATAGWSIARLAIDDDRAIYIDRLRSVAGTLTTGVPAVGHLDYTALTRPTRLLVDAPAGVRWDVAAVYTG